MTAKNGLYGKMAQIMASINSVTKDGKMSAGKLNYDFVRDVDVYRVVRDKLAEHNVALFASMTDVQQDRYVVGTDNYGNEKDKYHTRARFEFVLADSDSGETMTCVWHAEAEDSGDKGVNKCATAALKYWLLKTFIIPTGDDPDEVPSGKFNASEKPPKHTSKPASKPDAPKAAPWYASDRLSKMVDWAAETLWMGELERPHAINRIAVALGVKGTPNGDFNALAEMAAAQLADVSDDDAMRRVQTYEPQSDGTRKKAS